MSHELYGDGNKKNLLTDAEYLGIYVARIVGDERTLNQNVIVWEDEKTLLEAQEIGERISGESNLIRSKRTNVTYEELVARAKAGKEAYQRSHSYADLQLLGVSEYMISMHILGENTLENAKALGALNVRELYPDIKPVTLKEYAKRFYKTA